jgi:SpoVK/Ycf46/Vps4 family AAA+-type ATPase
VQGAIVRAPRPLWSRLVLDPETSDRLDEVVRRYRHRVTVRNRWGLDSGGRGLVVMLTGDSGVGKTMAAEAVAARLGLPIMVADLSLIVSKYIGETERNLSELFEAAEGFAAVVFFDEADALFGKRTAVEDAHDRYANIEINFLLQRLEAFEGIALLATNLAQGVDTAFHRRFDLVVDIPRPAAGERVKLWRGHLPKDRFDKALDLDFIAERFELTGGEIRNAALAAAYRAAERGKCVSAAMLRDAIAEEFAKKGRPMPAWPEAGDV